MTRHSRQIPPPNSKASAVFCSRKRIVVNAQYSHYAETQLRGQLTGISSVTKGVSSLGRKELSHATGIWWTFGCTTIPSTVFAMTKVCSVFCSYTQKIIVVNDAQYSHNTITNQGRLTSIPLVTNGILARGTNTVVSRVLGLDTLPTECCATCWTCYCSTLCSPTVFVIANHGCYSFTDVSFPTLPFFISLHATCCIEWNG